MRGFFSVNSANPADFIDKRIHIFLLRRPARRKANSGHSAVQLLPDGKRIVLGKLVHNGVVYYRKLLIRRRVIEKITADALEGLLNAHGLIYRIAADFEIQSVLEKRFKLNAEESALC